MDKGTHDFNVDISPGEVTPEDITRLNEQEASLLTHAGDHSSFGIMTIETNAMLAITNIDGCVSRQWDLAAKLVFRIRPAEDMAFNLSATAPFANYTVDQAKRRWEQIIVTGFIDDLMIALNRSRDVD